MNRRALWTAREAGLACEGDLIDGAGRPSADWIATGVSIDTRTLAPGDLFVALQGDARDGHEFVDRAFAAGAAAALVARRPEGAPADGPLILADDTLAALERLGAAARNRTRARRIAVTGSVGKTSVKELLRAALAPLGRTHASERSYNNHWGVPLTLARMPQDSVYGVFEIGMNHAGEITPLTKMVHPDAAIITTIGPAHLGNFDSVDDIAEAKAEIFRGLDGGAAVINRDNPYFRLLKNRALECGADEVIGFGAHEEAEVRLMGYAPTAKGALVDLSARGFRMQVALPLAGAHQAMNALAAIAAAMGIGVSARKAAEGLEAAAEIGGRGARRDIAWRGGVVHVIDESYNANPLSMRAAIEALRDAPAAGRRAAALGDMLELGPQAGTLHAALAEPLTRAGVDAVFLCGENMAHLRDALPKSVEVVYEPNADRLGAALSRYLEAGDVVMVKGSNSLRMSAAIAALEAAAKTFEGET